MDNYILLLVLIILLVVIYIYHEPIFGFLDKLKDMVNKPHICPKCGYSPNSSKVKPNDDEIKYASAELDDDILEDAMLDNMSNISGLTNISIFEQDM